MKPTGLPATAGAEPTSVDPAVPGRPAAPVAPPRQRWRLYVAQPTRNDAERRVEEGALGWAGILAGSGLPLAGEGGPRLRVAQAAPLPPGIAGEREVVDVYLAGRRTVSEVRAAVTAALPSGWRLAELHDVWVGAPAAPAAVVAADYRVLVAGAPRWALEGAVMALLAATALPRERRREKKTTVFDLRPLLLDLQVRSSGGDGVTLAMRLRHAPGAVGRPEEVVAALGEPPVPSPDAPLLLRSVVRERLIMADDPDAPPDL